MEFAWDYFNRLIPDIVRMDHVPEEGEEEIDDEEIDDIDEGDDYETESVASRALTTLSRVSRFTLGEGEELDVSLSNVIEVPDEDTKIALLYHIMSTPKIKWPVTFPNLVLYSWDIETGPDESVYLNPLDLVQQMIV